MKAFLYGVSLQFKLDLRSKTMLITCYVVPLMFFALMGGIFTSINPEAKLTIIQSMTIFAVSMGSLVGMPPSVVEVYGTDIKKMYSANGVPLYLGIVTQFISSFIHLLIMSVIIFAVAPIAFSATLPENIALYFVKLSFFIMVSLSIGSLLGLMCKSQSKLTMISQIVFLPSIMLSGIMFPITMLPSFMQYVGYIFPATIGYMTMTSFHLWQIFALFGVFIVMLGLVAVVLKRISKR